MEDLIDFSDTPVAKSTHPPSFKQTGSRPNATQDEDWAPLLPDKPGTNRLSSPSTSRIQAAAELPPTSADAALVSFATRVEDGNTSNTPARAKAIPLPSSPPDHETISNADSSSSRSHSTLSAEAQPFRTSGSIRIVRTQTPLSFFPAATSSSAGTRTQWSDGAPTRNDEMDPNYYRSGYDGRSSTSGSEGSRQPAAFFTPAQSSSIKITSPAQSTPPHSPNRSALTSPLSMTTMQDRPGERTPSTTSSPSPRFSPQDVAEQEQETEFEAGDDRARLGHITDSLRSFSLSHEDSSSEEAPNYQASKSNPHNGLLPVAHQPGTSTPLSYTRSAGGLLTPEHTGSSRSGPGAPVSPGKPNDHESNADQSEHEQEQDTTLVEHDRSADTQNSLGELDDISGAWMTLLRSVGAFQGSLEEGLGRLRSNLSRPVEVALADSHEPNERLHNARQLAYAASLRSTRAKLEESRAKNEEAQLEIRRLTQLVSDTERKAKSASVELHVKEEERQDLLEEAQLSGKRAKEVAGRLLRLEEDYAVLKQRCESSKKETFIAVLLEGDGRMFDWVGENPFESGQNLATSLVDQLSSLYLYLKGSKAPSMLIHLFLDVNETTQDLLRVGRISRPQDLVQYLQGFQQALEIGAVSDVRGLHGPSASIKAYLDLYSTLPQCPMVILGTGWNRPYLALVDKWTDNGRIDKLYAIRSTRKFEKDPFARLGPDKLLYVDCLFNTDVKEWKALLKGAAEAAPIRSSPPASPSFEPSSTSSSTVAPHHGSSRAISSDIDIPSMAPPWQVHSAPKPSSGGSLLDQLESMRRSGTSSRTSSPDSDRTVGPAPAHDRPGLNRSLAIKLDDEGSIGGSPPSSDSDDPSVTLPHSARKYVRRPIPFAEADRDDNVSEISSFTASSVSTAPPAASSIKSRSRTASVSTLPPVRRAANNGYGGPGVSGTNMTPLGVGRSDRYPSTATSARLSWAERKGMDEDLIDLQSRNTVRTAGADMVHGFKWHDGTSATRARRLTQEYKNLRSLGPSPCHRFYLEGQCTHRSCQYGHDYTFDKNHLHMLRVLAKEMNCRRVRGRCDLAEEECIYSHRCPFGQNCRYGHDCWFIDRSGRLIV